MNIIHVVEPFASGIAVFVKSLVENMKDDFHIIVHGERDAVMKAAEVKKSFTSKNVQFIHWKTAQREISLVKDFRAFFELYRLLKQIQKNALIDAVHLHSSKSGFLGRLACKLANIDNVVYTPNGAPFLVGTKKIKNFFYKVFEKIGNAFGGKVVCCSESEMHAYQDLGIDAIKINNGVTIRQQSPLRNVPEKAARFRIVTAARILNQKNPSLFNDIAKQFEHLDQFEFIWIGDGEESEKLTSSNITVTGWIPSAQARELMVGADLYLSTSNFEGLSFSVLEALSIRKPVLLKDCVGNKDAVMNGLNGDLFESEGEAVTKIMQYYNNPEMLRLMGEYSRKFCTSEFNVRFTSSSYRKLYSSQHENFATTNEN